ncbi:MAG TPA: nucleotide exchange factor GrpE [Bacteroidia bacterium]|nr:nucleotide exchange factor GrpE [Bacteroidia bacterium]
MSEEKQETPVNESEMKKEEKNQPGLPSHPDDGVEKRIADLEEQLSAVNDKFLRIYSEFDNFRRRTAKERVEILTMASADVIKSLLPVLDDFERAIINNENSTDITAINEGILLIAQKLGSILSKNGLQPIESIGKPFDVDLHEAITNVPAPTPDDKGKVLDEVEKGYMLNGKVIRFAKVVVGN